MLGEELTAGDTTIVFIKINNGGTGFAVGVKTKLPEATHALVTVFYHGTLQGVGDTVLSHQAMAPIMPNQEFGSTRDAFPVAKEKLAFIRVQLFTLLGERDFR